MNDNLRQKLNKFLNLASSQKEVSLVIAKDGQELQEFQEVLGKSGLKKVEDIFALNNRIKNPHKSFLTLSKTFDKNIYDFLIQYPTGQVEIFDNQKMKTETLLPHYQGSTILFLTTAENLNQIQKKGFDFLSNIGLVYRN